MLQQIRQTNWDGIQHEYVLVNINYFQTDKLIMQLQF